MHCRLTVAVLVIISLSLAAQTEPPPFDATACLAAAHPAAVAVNDTEYLAHMGFAVASGGDWDGDGFEDVLVSCGLQPGSVKVWLFYGPNLSHTLAFVIDPFNNQLANLVVPSVAFVGDINGDGYSDIAIGDPFWIDTKGTATTSDDVADAGRVLIYLGSATPPPSGTTITIHADPCNPADLVQPDIILEYDGPDPMWFGASLAGGNVANSFEDPYPVPPPPQQYSDVIVGAPGRQDEATLPNVNVPGQVFVFLGGPHDPAHSPPLLALAGPCGPAGQCTGQQKPITIQATQCAFRTITGFYPHDRFGFSVASVGDVYPLPGNGFQEVVIGAPQGQFSNVGRTQFVDAYKDSNGNVLPGYAEVWSGSHNWELLSSPAEAGKVVSLFGWSVSSAGDFDDDAIEDIVVGAPGYGDPDDGTATPIVNSGAMYVYTGLFDPSVGYSPIAGPVTLATMSNASESPVRGDLFGFSVSGRVGHHAVGQARDEVVVGVPLGTNPRVHGDPCGCVPTGGTESGRAYDIGLWGNGSSLTRHAYAVYRGEAQRDGLGWAVRLGDISHSGTTHKLDVVCGVPRNSLNCSNIPPNPNAGEEGELDVFAGESVTIP